MMEVKAKTADGKEWYTSADFEKAREEERGRAVESIAKLLQKKQDAWPPKMLEALDHAMSEIELLGPVSDIELRVKRDIKKWIIEHGEKIYDHHTPPFCQLPKRNLKGYCLSVEDLDAIVRGRDDGKW